MTKHFECAPKSRKLQYCLGLNRLIMDLRNTPYEGFISVCYVHSKGFTYLKDIKAARTLMSQVLRSTR